MEIKKEIRNDLLKRTEIKFILESDKNPSYDEVKKLISEQYSKTPECVDILNINGRFGRSTFLIIAYVYDSPDILTKVKNLTRTKKQKDGEKKAVEETKKAEAEAKKKAEEPKVEEEPKVIEAELVP
jgi:ribosomal protein S24E